ncbi:SAM-dependent methyltransferase [Kibdelosporangium lantanae]|uniref:SAM-dependent methyltransferase n=1 Tax=Kibdelosporangium lantanae TaxID=1497396 RepID=A0ABW3M8P8_9PSEU
MTDPTVLSAMRHGDACDGEDSRHPPEIDTSKASIARVYDAFLGGKDNFASDRVVYDSIIEIAPQAAEVAKANRRWLTRVVGYLSRYVGIVQYLDLGAGLPTMENTHQAAQRHKPNAVVIYVDNDPAVNAYGRALLEENDHTHFITADLTQPATLLEHPTVTRALEFDRPMALIQCATLHHVDDQADPAGIMRQYIDALPSGSYVALTHWWDPADGSAGSTLAQEMQRRMRTSSMGTGRYRTREDILSFFHGLQLLEPGLVKLDEWWPPGPPIRERSLVEHLILGAVGRKP